MSAIKRELERLADIVIYGNAETIQREFEKVSGLHDNGAIGLLAEVLELSRAMSPLCKCGADYHLGLTERFPQWIADTNEQSAAACNCSQLDDDLAADGWTCYACHATNRDKSRQVTNA
jgi:hypothetical protein